MALPGMKSTADFATDERPKNWREGIMLLEPRNKMPLFALTSAMSSESTDDAEFNWWDEALELYNFTLNDATGMSDSDTTVVVDQDAKKLKPGDMLRNSRTGEAVRVVSITNSTTFEVTRAVGAGGTAAGTAAAMNDNDKLLYLGSAYREGAPRSIGVSHNPTKHSNVTQIFRDPVEWTRTAMKTRYRTGDPQKNDRRRALNKHGVGIERALWLGTRFETLESGQPLRFTDGLLNFVTNGAPSNVVTAPADMDLETFEAYYASIFAYGSGEKLAFGSIATMMKINTLIRKNTNYQWGPGETEYGMRVKRLYGLAGTLVLTEHPMFGQAGDFLANDLFIMDTANLRYRYITDTTLLKDREDNGTDGKAEEYLTECGLEVHHPSTFFWLKSITNVVQDS